MFEDIEHGSDMQMSTLTLNLFEAVALDRNMPEELLINTDNTAKETKNNICMWWMIWFLCVCEDNRLPLWSMLLINLIVGHTHSKCDRFFSRIRAALNGHDYYTMEQMIEIVVKALRGFNVHFAHLNSAWSWRDELKTLGLPEFKGLRRVHCINFFRGEGGIWVKWKQFMTSTEWSTPLLVVRPACVHWIASFRPTQRKQDFKADHKNDLLNWLMKFKDSLSDAQNTIAKRKGDVEWIRDVILGQREEYRKNLTIDQLFSGMGVHMQGPRSSCELACEMPPDAIVALFPGADLPPIPADNLIHVTGVSPATRATMLGPGSLVICMPTEPMIVCGQELPFCLGQYLAIDDLGADDDTLTVQWLVPGVSREALGGVGGRRKEVVDIFGPWEKHSALDVERAREVSLPKILIHRDQALLINVELDADKRLPFSAFDELSSKYALDCTAMSVSRTHFGGLYRTYVLMRANRE